MAQVVRWSVSGVGSNGFKSRT